MASDEELKYGGKDPELLKRFLEEFFDFDGLCVSGFWGEELRDNHYGQAKRICTFFGLTSIYEYGSSEVRCHITEDEPTREKEFVTVFKNIYEE
jgi:hypothetical protein